MTNPKTGVDVTRWIVAAPDWLDPKWGGPNVEVVPGGAYDMERTKRLQAEHERDVLIEQLAQSCHDARSDPEFGGCPLEKRAHEPSEKLASARRERCAFSPDSRHHPETGARCVYCSE